MDGYYKFRADFFKNVSVCGYMKNEVLGYGVYGFQGDDRPYLEGSTYASTRFNKLWAQIYGHIHF